MPSFAKPWSVPALILVQENYRTPSATWSTTSCGRFATPLEWPTNRLAYSVCGTNLSKLARGCFHGVGRSTALFYAKSQLQETGAIGLNQRTSGHSLHRSLLPSPCHLSGLLGQRTASCAHKLESNARGDRRWIRSDTPRKVHWCSGCGSGAEQSAWIGSLTHGGG